MTLRKRAERRLVTARDSSHERFVAVIHRALAVGIGKAHSL
jgi:hypothetical protein